MQHQKIHKDFKINGKDFSSIEEILRYTIQEARPIFEFLTNWFSKNAILQVKTSGSTGTPKEISLKKEHVINSALATGDALKLTNKTSALLCLPIEYIAGKLMVVRALVLGWDLHIIKPTSNPLENSNRNFDFTALVPLQLKNGITQLHLFKKIIVGGGVVSKELHHKIQSVNTQIYATYGMTETITHVALKPLNNLRQKPNFFKVLPNVSIYKDERDCLVIKAPNVSDETIFTNDIVELISENEFNWLGRYDNVINSGGVKLNSEVIEQKLGIVTNNRFFVAGLPDDNLGNRLVLLIEGEPQELNFERANLSRFETPKKIYFIESFVETSSGKIQRKNTLKKLNLI